MRKITPEKINLEVDFAQLQTTNVISPQYNVINRESLCFSNQVGELLMAAHICFKRRALKSSAANMA